MAAQLFDLLAHLPDARLFSGDNVLITGISINSRVLKPGDLFVALRGNHTIDRHPYVPEAVAAGAAAVVVEVPPPTNYQVPVVLVPSTRLALSALAAAFYNFPANHLTMLGITGTNGKTTTATLLHSILLATDLRPGLIGTIEYRIGSETIPSWQTTPEAHELHRILRQMVSGNCSSAVMEVSSHSLDQGRVAHIPFRAAVLTNITRDHLDYHGTFDAYVRAKASLFEGLDSDALAVINIDDPSAGSVLANCRARLLKYSLTQTADVRLLEYVSGWDYMRLHIQTTSGLMNITSPLAASYHCPNILASIAVALDLGISPAIISDALSTTQLPGRFERITCGQDFTVVVDYAHTPDALEKALRSARDYCPRRLVIVFGCDGDRDRGKRPDMGRIASCLADEVILTTSHPATEDPAQIAREVLAGATGSARLIQEPDRRSAIALAIQEAQVGDLVLIAGKGHESYQEIGRTKFPFDDRTVTRELLISHLST